jgi:CHASE3 domain sensor protein
MVKQKLDDANADPTTTPERKKALEKSLELATAQVELADKTIPKKGKNFLSLYKTLLGDNV